MTGYALVELMAGAREQVLLNGTVLVCEEDARFTFTGGAFGGTEASMGASVVLAIGKEANIQLLIMSKPTYVSYAIRVSWCCGTVFYRIYIYYDVHCMRLNRGVSRTGKMNSLSEWAWSRRRLNLSRSAEQLSLTCK
jgi:hypothetical protein